MAGDPQRADEPSLQPRRPLEDDRLVEVSWNGEIVWEWIASDHIDALGFAPDARKVIKAAPGFNKARGTFDWLHVNSAT